MSLSKLQKGRYGTVITYYGNSHGPHCREENWNEQRRTVKLRNEKNLCFTNSDEASNNYNVKQRKGLCDLHELTLDLMSLLNKVSTIADLCLYMYHHDLRYKLVQKSNDLLDNISLYYLYNNNFHCPLLIQYWHLLTTVLQTYDAFIELSKILCKGQTENGLTILARQRVESSCELSRDKMKPDTSVKLTTNSDLSPEIRILRNLPDGRPNRVVRLCLPVFQGMENPNRRLQTYSHWPTKTKQWPLQLSNAGFYFTGTGTVVKCATCGVETDVGSWSMEKPEVVHCKLNNECDFLQANFPNLHRKNNHESDNATGGVCNHKFETVVSNNNHFTDQHTVVAKQNHVQPSVDTTHNLDQQPVTAPTRSLNQQSKTALPQSSTGTRTHDEQSWSNLRAFGQQSMDVLQSHVEQTITNTNDQHSELSSSNDVQQSAPTTRNHRHQCVATTRNLDQRFKADRGTHSQQSVIDRYTHDERSKNDNTQVVTTAAHQDSDLVRTALNINNHFGNISLSRNSNYWIADASNSEMSLTTLRNNSRDRPAFRQDSLEHQPLTQSNNCKKGTSWTNANNDNLTSMDYNTTRSYLDDSGRSIHENYHPNMNRGFPIIYSTALQKPEISNQNMTRSFMGTPLDGLRIGLNGSSIYMDFPSFPSVNNREYEPVFSHPQYRQLDTRLQTFQNWTKNQIQSTKTLAECGLFFTGKDDIVRCFCCNLGLSEWAADDNPWTEHAKHQPKCWFLRQQKGQGFIDQVQETWKKQYTPKNAAFDDYNSRLATFGGWREDISQTPETLAEAGFFFTGEEDIVRCHYCDGGLRNWEPNDIPWEEHARWFSSCKFLIKMKGMRYIQTIKENYENGSNTRNTDNQATSTTENNLMESERIKSVILMGFSTNEVTAAIKKYTQVQGNSEFTSNDLVNTIIKTRASSANNEETIVQNRPDPEEKRDLNSLRVINSDLKAKRICVLCKHNERCMLFTNCGHRVTCERCCDSIDFCPTCHKRIKKRIKTFLS